MTIFPHGGKWEIIILPYVLMDRLEQKICQDSNLRVKLIYESVKEDMFRGYLFVAISLNVNIWPTVQETP